MPLARSPVDFLTRPGKRVAPQGMTFVRRPVPVMTLARVCEEHVDRRIDFLKIDAEGHEREVIEGGDWGRWRPRIILVEATWPDRWEPQLLAADYRFAAFDGLNRYYVRAEDSHLTPAFMAPVCFHDDYIPYRYQATLDEMRPSWAAPGTWGPMRSPLRFGCTACRPGFRDSHGRYGAPQDWELEWQYRGRDSNP